MSEKGDGKKTRKNNELSNAAKTMGAAGGLKGGPARAAALSAEERSKIASEGGKAAAAKRKAVKQKIKKKGKGKG
jgi:hypothetical protein